MNPVTKPNNAWILCPSKTFPGKFYYFNTINGETVWSLNDVEKKNSMRNFIHRITDKWHSYPEPDSPPTDDKGYPGYPNWANRRYQYRPDPAFGQASFPKYTEPYIPNMYHQIPPTMSYPHYDYPNWDMDRYYPIERLPFYDKPEKDIYGIGPRFDSTPRKWDFERPTFMPQKAKIFETKRYPQNYPDIFKRKIPEPVPKVFQDSSRHIFQPPVQKRVRTLSDSTIDETFVAPPKRTGHSVDFFSYRDPRKFNSNSLDDMSMGEAVHVMHEKPNYFAQKPNSRFDFNTQNTFQAKLQNPQKPFANPSKNPFQSKSMSNLYKNKFKINEAVTKDTFLKEQRKQEFHAMKRKIQRNESNCTATVTKPDALDEPDTNNLETVKIIQNEGNTTSIGIASDTNEHLVLSEDDLRYKLLSKVRKPERNVKINESEKRGTVKKRVRFENEDDEDHTLDEGNYDEMEPLTLAYLSSLAKPGSNQDQWYIAVDAAVLLDSFEFLENYVQEDDTCVLLVPLRVQTAIKATSVGDCSERRRVLQARRAARRLAARAPHVRLQSFEADESADTGLNESIVNCCVQMMQENYHVVLITNSDDLYAVANAAEIYCFSLDDIKAGIDANKPEVLFDIQKVNRTKTNEKSTKNPDPNGRIITWNDGNPTQKLNISTQKEPTTSHDFGRNLTWRVSNDGNTFGNKFPVNCFRKGLCGETENKRFLNNNNVETTKNHVILQKNSELPNDENPNFFFAPKNLSDPKNLIAEVETSVSTSDVINKIQNLNLEDSNAIQNCQISNSDPVPNMADSAKGPNLAAYGVIHLKSVQINSYSLNEHIRRFLVKDKMVEEGIKTRMDEWICSYTQIMEETLSDILRSTSGPASPNTLLEAVEGIRDMFADNSSIQLVVEKLTEFLLLCTCEKGKLKSTIRPNDFMRILGCGRLLIQCLQDERPNSDCLLDAIYSLKRLLENILEPKSESQSPMIDTPVAANSEPNEPMERNRANFVKKPSEILEYVQKHYSDNNNEERLDSEVAMLTEKQPDKPKVIRVSGKNINHIKIDNTKSITMTKSNNTIIETPKMKPDMTFKEKAHLLKTLALNPNFKKLKDIDLDKREQLNEELTAMIDDIVHKNGQTDINDNENDASKRFKVADAKTFANTNDCNVYKRIDVNSKFGKTKTTKNYDNIYNVNKTSRNDAIFKNNADAAKLVNNFKNMETYKKKFRTVNVDLDVLDYNYDDTDDDSRKLIIDSDYDNHNDNENNHNEYNDKADTTNDSGIENDSTSACVLARMFLKELSETFKDIYQFIDSMINEFMQGIVGDEKKKCMRDQTAKTHSHMGDIVGKLNRCGRAGSLAANPGEKLLELLRVTGGTPRRHSTAACAPNPQAHAPPRGFVYCPSDALPYCPPSRLAPPPQRQVKLQPLPQPIQPPTIQTPQPPPVPVRSAPAPPPAPPRRAPPPAKRAPPPTPPRPQATDPKTDPNGNRRIPPAPLLQKLDCNRNPQPPVPRRPPQKMPDTPYTPAPIPTNQTMKRSPSSGSNISVRQDSNVSSDSFSQTSSPSYTTKTMEAPLLPHQHVNKSLNAKIARGLLLKEQQEKEAGNQSITKSMSTPASLQTIVRFQNGSNMSLHHRMLRDMRGGAGAGSPHRFRLLQVALNAVALLAIAGALFAYFRANPAVQVRQVQYVSQVVNRTLLPWALPTEPPGARNPAPGVCLPVIVHFCQQHRISYNFTVFPNYIGHFGQRDAQQDLEIYDAVVDVRCYELTALFLCSLFVPKCGPLGHMVRPCKSLCQETMRRCGFFLEVFGLAMPEYLQCDMFPESTDTDVCLGNREVKEARFRASKPVCPNGFQCDVKRCIPHDWRCDGHIDCADRSDELNCRVCKRSGDVHCGNQQCISQTHICDGRIDCPWGQDERNCLRLSEANGDVGKGELQVYRAANQSWFPACLTTLDDGTEAKLCSMLGYKRVNHTASKGITGSGVRAGRVHLQGAAHLYRAFLRSEGGLLRELKECRHDTTRVHLVCSNYECGKRRVTASATKRIVGGTEALPGDWPFLAAIMGGPEEVFYCAGVLVADQWVLSASHCVGNHSEVDGWTIQLGITRRRSHAYYGQKVKVKRVVPHPLYNIGVAHDNDVALFQLAVRVRYHEHLAPVCLPPAARALPAGTLCTVIGWGKRDDKDMSEYEPTVNEVEVPVLNRDLCNQWLEHRDLNVTEGMICAGYPEGGKDACQGDSGGPLLCKDPDDESRWFVGGIVSWGIKCAHPRLPGVYAYVPHYIPWIEQQIQLYHDENLKTDDVM